MINRNAGAIARGKIIKQEALDKYNASPKICKYCLSVILVLPGQKPSEAKSKDFCNHSCSAKFNNHLHIRKVLRRCGIKINFAKQSKWTRSDIKFGLRAKGELFKNRSNWQSARSSIRAHAAKVWRRSEKELKCNICGYDKHAEIAHIKSVSEFSNDVLIQEVNAIGNLVALCPNHHWEFDNLQRDSEKVS